jgi:hypothetical protein
MQFGTQEGIRSLKNTYAVWKMENPDRVPALKNVAPAQQSAPAPRKEPMPGLASARAKGGSGAPPPVSFDEFVEGNFPNDWLLPNGEYNMQKVPRHYIDRAKAENIHI